MLRFPWKYNLGFACAEIMLNEKNCNFSTRLSTFLNIVIKRIQSYRYRENGRPWFHIWKISDKPWQSTIDMLFQLFHYGLKLSVILCVCLKCKCAIGRCMSYSLKWTLFLHFADISESFLFHNILHRMHLVFSLKSIDFFSCSLCSVFIANPKRFI